jgi:hypothetical protein
MLVYEQFSGAQEWHPRELDRLTDEELFWLPVVRAAKQEAAEVLAKVHAASGG